MAMVDGISFLNTGLSTGTNGVKADAARSIVADPNTLTAVPVQGASTPATPDDSSKTAKPQPVKETPFAADTQATLLKTQEDQNGAAPQPTRTKQEVSAAVKSFDETQSLRNAQTPDEAQKPAYANAATGVKVNV